MVAIRTAARHYLRLRMTRTVSMPEPESPPSAPIERREFLKSAACTVLGGCCFAAPIVAGVVVVTAPLRQKGPPVEVKLATLDALPVGGAPKLFQIITDRRDAWTQFPKQAIGSVFLLRTSEAEVVAFHSACPHLGCAVEFREEISGFYCPCHDSSFAKSGDVVGKSPSLRGLDTLKVEVRGREVWVKFINFKAGIREKVATA